MTYALPRQSPRYGCGIGPAKAFNHRLRTTAQSRLAPVAQAFCLHRNRGLCGLEACATKDLALSCWFHQSIDRRNSVADLTVCSPASCRLHSISRGAGHFRARSLPTIRAMHASPVPSGAGRPTFWPGSAARPPSFRRGNSGVSVSLSPMHRGQLEGLKRSAVRACHPELPWSAALLCRFNPTFALDGRRRSQDQLAIPERRRPFLRQ